MPIFMMIKAFLIFAYIHCLVCVSTGFQICANENMGVVTRNHTPYGGEPPLLIFLEITTGDMQAK